eukprot:m.42133 g.42133  ORF g.42133 m.42133 type:complete len:438 (-) comp12860_c0_seq1:61-1374(-)
MFRKRLSTRGVSQTTHGTLVAQDINDDASVTIDLSHHQFDNDESQLADGHASHLDEAIPTSVVVVDVTELASSERQPSSTSPKAATPSPGPVLAPIPSYSRRHVQRPPPLAKADTVTIARYRVWRDATNFLSSISLHGGGSKNRRTMSVTTHLDDASSEDDSTSARDLGLDVMHVVDITNIQDKKLLVGSRVIFTSPSGSPIVTTTMLEPKIARKRRFAGLELPTTGSKEATSSGSRLKIDKGTRSYREELTAVANDITQVSQLDDPGLHHGRHQKVIVLPSYHVSLTKHAEPSVLKKELNSKFKERHPNIDLSLTKLRSLKRDMRTIGRQCNLNSSTVAIAQLNFDRVVLSGLVNKEQRKVLAACCVVLAYKFDASTKPSVTKTYLKELFKVLEEKWRVESEDIIQAEMAVYSALSFHLHVELHELRPYLRTMEES